MRSPPERDSEDGHPPSLFAQQLDGTPRGPVDTSLADGRSVILDIDVLGASQVRTTMPEAVHIFILPPSRAELIRRLRARGDDENLIQRRMDLVDDQLRGASSFDYLVINDDRDTAHAVLQGILLAELHRRTRRSVALTRILDDTGDKTDPNRDTT